MSNKSLEQALANLLPTHADALPPDLIKHASTLLAQSRSYGSSLKPEEEIARPYVCAEIACKRLSKTLKLPPLIVRPPCPPRVYKKLYGYLEQALLKASAGFGRDTLSGSRTGSQRTPTGTPRKATSNATPSKSPSKTLTPKRPLSTTSPQKTGATPRTKGRAQGLSNASVKDAPAWTMPLIRRVCKTLATPTPSTTPLSRPSVSMSLPPHIFAGVSSVISFVRNGPLDNTDEQYVAFVQPIIENNGKAEQPEYKDRVMTLIVAIYFIALSHRREDPSSKKSKSKTSSSNLDVDTYIEMSKTALESIGMTSDEHVNDVDAWISIVMNSDYTKGREWYDNIPGPNEEDNNEVEGGFEENQGEFDDGNEEDEVVSPKKRRLVARELRQIRNGKGTNEPRDGGLLPGLGTMMQDRVDWLSDERRADYAEWKEGVIQRIREIERSGVAAA